MALFKPYRVTSSQLSSLPILDGQLILVTDTQEMYLDNNTDRVLISSKTPDISISASEPSSQNAGDLWLVLTEE